MASDKAIAKTNPATSSDPFADCYGDDAPKGLEETGNPEIHGWWNPEPGLTFHGKLVGSFKIEDTKNRRMRDVVIVKLLKPAKAADTDEKGLDGKRKGVRLEVGQNLAVSVSYRLLDVLSYVEHHGEVWAKALEKKDIGHGQSMWQYDLRVRGQRSTPVAPTSTEDAPF